MSKDPADDPYKILALNLVSSCSNPELKTILHDSKAIRRRVTREVYDADFYGPFLDCLMTEIIRHNKRRALWGTLHETTNFFYNRLDVPRLRAEIKYYCEKFGRDIE